jgi:hypothetical protein
MINQTITIKSADKNLGLVMVDTSWYEEEPKRMLSDRVTYKAFNDKAHINGKMISCTKDKLPGTSLQRI